MILKFSEKWKIFEKVQKSPDKWLKIHFLKTFSELLHPKEGTSAQMLSFLWTGPCSTLPSPKRYNTNIVWTRTETKPCPLPKCLPTSDPYTTPPPPPPAAVSLPGILLFGSMYVVLVRRSTIACFAPPAPRYSDRQLSAAQIIYKIVHHFCENTKLQKFYPWYSRQRQFWIPSFAYSTCFEFPLLPTAPVLNPRCGLQRLFWMLAA